MVESLVTPEDMGFNESDRATVNRTIGARRDVRRGFIDRPLPDELLQRLLAAAHSAPSVGPMQPSRFIVIRDLATRTAVHNIFQEADHKAATTYRGEQRERYAALKLEGVLEAPQNLCIACDTQNERETAAYSTVCAIHNLWLAARAEGIGVGWLSILDPARLRTLFHIPDHILLVAYLCLGFVRSGWEKRVPVQTAVCYDVYSEDNAS
jgi:5,6-dimethylbenzimidazole synthase